MRQQQREKKKKGKKGGGDGGYRENYAFNTLRKIAYGKGILLRLPVCHAWSTRKERRGNKTQRAERYKGGKGRRGGLFVQRCFCFSLVPELNFGLNSFLQFFFDCGDELMTSQPVSLQASPSERPRENCGRWKKSRYNN